MKKIVYTTLIALLFNPVFAQQMADGSKFITGTVFLDINQDGQMDKKEKGIKGILVSNGSEIVQTDKNGNYKLSVSLGQHIFPILPSDFTYSNAKSSNILNANFVNIPTLDSLHAVERIDIPLYKQAVSSTFTFGAIGDVQVDNTEELNYASKSIFAELSNKDKHVFNIFLGDLVNDKMPLMKDVRRQLDYMATPSMTLVGNHDRNTGNQDYLNDSFHNYLGASHYAFNYGKVHFIILNNVYATGKNSYEGRIDEQQMKFIREDLKHVDKSTAIVLSQHIPLVATKNRNELLDLLKDYANVLVLSGHTHVVSRHFFKYGNVHELGAGATSGTWWRGEKDSDGIPLSLMQCGTPRGYFAITYENGKYTMQYKGVGKDENQQMHITLQGTKLIANIYAASDSSSVQLKINNEEWMPMKKEKIVDPIVEKILANNKANIYPTPGNTVLPLRARPSSHIWTLDLWAFPLEEPTLISVHAKDSYGFEVKQQVMIYPNL